VREGEEGTLDGYETVSEGLEDASLALDKAGEDFLSIGERLRKIIEGIQMEALSERVQGK
jgi:hypothetical protein